MADRIATVTRALNDVQSVGEARAALNAASAELDRGQGLISGLSSYSVPTPEEAQNTIALYRPLLAAELRLLAPSPDTSPVDPGTWQRTRDEITHVYVDVSGIEGVAGALAAIDVGQILVDAIAGAPKVLGLVVGDVLSGTGQAAGGLLGGVFKGAGFWGTLVLIVIAVLVLRPGRLLKGFL